MDKLDLIQPLFDYQKWDLALFTLYTNIFSLSKADEKIVISNYNDKKCSHKCFLREVLAIHTIYKRPIYFETSLIKYLILKLKYRKLFDFKRVNKKEKQPLINANREIENVCQAYGFDESLFDKIYKNYFERKK